MGEEEGRMNLMLFRHLWGVAGEWGDSFPRFKRAGYRGIESALPRPEDRKRFRALLRRHGLGFIPQIFSHGSTVAEHLESLHEQIAIAKAFGPRFINAHSGQDAFSEDESIHFFEGALRLENQCGLALAHETHRGRILFSPWITSRVLARFPELKLCCDFSHWVCVCERLIEDQIGIIRQCAEHCMHVHARVGYEQGPQVPDPRAPEYQRHLDAHEAWWRLIWATQERRGFRVSTLTPEFGPPEYQHTLPFTRVPVSNLEEICDWQARRQAENFARHARHKRRAG
jgi:sugar phosphate isomerase/epimerase